MKRTTPDNAEQPRAARRVWVEGIVQGVGFRPFLYRLAEQERIHGWVRNSERGVEMQLEGPPDQIAKFLRGLELEPPPAARISRLESRAAEWEGADSFRIVGSSQTGRPSTRVSPDLPVCEDCLAELFDPHDRRHLYPYINCTNCGPRFSIVLGLPYDREQTTMKEWTLCPDCDRQYQDPNDRRFHAQPVACPACGPGYRLETSQQRVSGPGAVEACSRLLQQGRIIALKGLGGYHLACDAQKSDVVSELRKRKYRKEKPFALMVTDLKTARDLVSLSPRGEAWLGGPERPIVVAPALRELPGVAPGSGELGVMLPYTPLHHLLFAADCPPVLVMTSANRSSEPIAYQDDEARRRLSGIADAFLVGRRPIARRVDDSVVRQSAQGVIVFRRARGLAPAVVAHLPSDAPLLALGGQMKSSLTLVVEGQAVMSQHLGDLEYTSVREAFRETVADLLNMYRLEPEEVGVVHDLHPQYASTRFAQAWPGPRQAVQHHRAHVAAVLAEHEIDQEVVLGFAWDGTGFGDDGAIWGGEAFAGSLRAGFERVRHLRPAALPGGDAAARHPVQAAAGFLSQLASLPDLSSSPFRFPKRFEESLQLIEAGVQVFPTTSIGRLFDTVAALAGFTRPVSYEGQAATWLEQLSTGATSGDAYPFPSDWDFRPLLEAVVRDRLKGRSPAEVGRAFHRGLAAGLAETAMEVAREYGIRRVAVSGGVFQNVLLLEMVHEEFSRRREAGRLELLTQQRVAPNDGGLSLGQAALGAYRTGEETEPG